MTPEQLDQARKNFALRLDKARETPEHKAVESLPSGGVLAAFNLDSVDEKKRTVDLVFTKGAQVLRGFWFHYYEELSLDPAHIRMGRFESKAAPLLNAHQRWEMKDQIGVIERASITKDIEGVCTVRFSKRKAVEEIWQDVKDGIFRNVSVGYFRYEIQEVEQPKADDEDEPTPVYRVVDWEPFEVSLVPVGADPDCQTRDLQTRGETEIETRPCTIILRADSARNNGSKTMTLEEKKKKAAIREGSQAAVETKPVVAERQPEQPAVDLEAEKRAARQGERERLARIEKTARTLGMPSDDKQVRELMEGDVDADEACRQLIDLAADRAPAKPNAVSVTQDEQETRAQGVEEALLFRFDKRNVMSEKGKPYYGLTLRELARQFCGAHGISVAGLGPMEIAGRALHSTSDFPNILANVANKTLRRAYDEAPQTFRPIVREVEISDFKQVSRNQLGEAPRLLHVKEGGEFTHGTVGEAKEVYALATYGRIVAITRQVIVNDDLDAFTRIPMMFGRAAADLESDLVWAQLAGNPAMGDGNNLFDASNHANFEASTSAISVTSVGAARAAMRIQTGVDGTSLLGLVPKYLIVPAAIETVADQFLSSAMLSATQAEANPFKNGQAASLEKICEPRLDVYDINDWYLAAAPSQIDTIEIGYLSGQRGVYSESRMGFEVDGVELKARLDVVSKAIDWRGFYKTAGV